MEKALWLVLFGWILCVVNICYIKIYKDKLTKLLYLSVALDPIIK